jgi:O-antigen ligase
MSASTEELQVQQRTLSEFFPGTLDQQRPFPIRRRSERLISALVVGLLSPFLALRSRYVQRALSATIILDIPLQLGTTFFHRPEEADFGAFRGLIVSATTLALAGLYASWSFEALADRNKLRPRFHVNLPLTLYLGFVMLSLVVAQDVSLSLFEVFLYVQLYLVYLYVANSVRNREDVLFVLSMLLIGGVVESLLIIGLKFTSIETAVLGPAHIYVESDPTSGWRRVGGTMGPNEAGAYLSVVLTFAASVLFTNIGRTYKRLAVAVLVFGQIAIIFTFSRGGWLALLVAVSALCAIAWHGSGFSLKVPAVILALLLLYIPFHDTISTRLFSNDNGAAESRIPLMDLAFRIISANPILGVGSNNFSVVMNDYLSGEFRSRNAFLFVVHNKYLLIWAETGILGLLAFLAFLLGTLRKGWQCWKVQDRLLSPLALGLAAGICGYMVHMGVDHFRNRAAQQLLWLIAGLLVAMHRILRAQAASFDPLSSIT